MGYTRLSIQKNDKIRKYILFYADYLNEAWLSEVIENDTSKIIKQFKCKNLGDLDELASYISKRGQIINLASNETAEDYLRILETKLANKPAVLSIIPDLGFTLTPYRMMWNRVADTLSTLKMAS